MPSTQVLKKIMKFYILFDWNEISKFTLLKLGGVEPQSCHGHLKVKGVNFAYPTRPKNPVMSDFSIEIKPGETVALVGESGQERVWIGIFYFFKIVQFFDYFEPLRANRHYFISFKDFMI